MAEGSKQGACSSNTQAAKANCLAHDRRQGKVPSYVNPSLTPNNRTVFEDSKILGRKSIVPLIRQAEKLYTERTGQKCQKSFTPFRESVLVVKEGVTDEQLMNWKAKAEQLMGWKVLGIWAHNDEGHYHSRFVEGDTDFAINHHVHVLWDCQDPQTGKSLRPTRGHFSAMQDVLAEAVGMERGNFAKDTGRQRRSSQEQRIKAQEERIAQLERIGVDKQKLIDDMVAEIDKLSKSKAVKDAAVAKLQEYAAKAKAGAAGAKEWAAGVFGLTAKDNTIKELQTQVQTLTKEKEEADKTAKEAYTKGVKAGKKSVCDEIYKRQKWDATTTLKDEHSVESVCRRYNDQAKELEEWKEKAIYWHDAAKGTHKQSQGQSYQR